MMTTISIKKLLEKMEEEIRLAKGASSETGIRERIYSIKTLCEVVLEEPARSVETVRMAEPVRFVQHTAPVVQNLQPVTINQPKPLKMDDESNGDSLFDF